MISADTTIEDDTVVQRGKTKAILYKIERSSFFYKENI